MPKIIHWARGTGGVSCGAENPPMDARSFVTDNVTCVPCRRTIPARTEGRVTKIKRERRELHDCLAGLVAFIETGHNPNRRMWIDEAKQLLKRVRP